MAEPNPGRVARARRESLGLTRDNLAARVGVSLSTVLRFEVHGHIPRPSTLVRIADALDLDVADIMPTSTTGATS